MPELIAKCEGMAAESIPAEGSGKGSACSQELGHSQANTVFLPLRCHQQSAATVTSGAELKMRNNEKLSSGIFLFHWPYLWTKYQHSPEFHAVASYEAVALRSQRNLDIVGILWSTQEQFALAEGSPVCWSPGTRTEHTAAL